MLWWHLGFTQSEIWDFKVDSNASDQTGAKPEWDRGSRPFLSALPLWLLSCLISKRLHCEWKLIIFLGASSPHCLCSAHARRSVAWPQRAPSNPPTAPQHWYILLPILCLSSSFCAFSICLYSPFYPVFSSSCSWQIWWFFFLQAFSTFYLDIFINVFIISNGFPWPIPTSGFFCDFILRFQSFFPRWLHHKNRNICHRFVDRNCGF